MEYWNDGVLGNSKKPITPRLQHSIIPEESKTMSKFPLEGIRVIELTTGAAGPTVARVLCEFGAEVIRCETRLRGDGHRGEDPAKWNKNPDFMKLQRGKKSFTVNMQTDKGRRLVRELIKISDVLVENYGLGILEKWGLDWPQLKEI